MNEVKLRELLLEIGITHAHKNRRGWLVAVCPFAEYLHEHGTDSNPSFCIKVNPEGYSGYKCFTCGVKGNLSKFLMTLGGYRGEDYNSLVIRAMMDETPESFQAWDDARAEFAEAEVLEPIEKEAYFRMFPPVAEFKEARRYLAKRGISDETIEILNLRYDPDEERVLFPVLDHSQRLYGFTGRTTIPRSLWPSKKYPKVKDYAGLRKEKLILGEHLIKPGKPILVVEGLFALAHMIEESVDEFCNPVATMGSSMSESQRDILVGYGCAVYMLYDNDVAGEKGLYGPVNRAGEHEGGGAVDLLKMHVPTLRVLYPEGVEDPDDLTYEEIFDAVVGSKNEMF